MITGWRISRPRLFADGQQRLAWNGRDFGDEQLVHAVDCLVVHAAVLLLCAAEQVIHFYEIFVIAVGWTTSQSWQEEAKVLTLATHRVCPC